MPSKTPGMKNGSHNAESSRARHVNNASATTTVAESAEYSSE
jgi:hypothetical protein